MRHLAATIIGAHDPLAEEGAPPYLAEQKTQFRDLLANMSRPKTEHYVPQFILRQFLVDESKEQVSVYDKHKDRGFTTSIKNVMAENRFHDFRFEDWIVSFEPIASKIEDLCLPTYQRVIETRCLEGSPQEKADLGFLMAFQMLRTKAARASFQEIGAAMKDKVEAMGHRVEDILGWEPQTEDTVKRATLMAIRDALPSYAEIIALKEFRLAEAAPGRSFYLGDNPVCLHNARTFGPRGNLGLAVPGIEIYLPLSSNLMLCAWCPSVIEEIRKDYDERKRKFTNLLLGHLMAGRISAATMKTQMESIRESWKPITAFIEASTLSTPMSSDIENMDFYNSLQTSNSYRYVVCQQSDFDLARRHNKEFPHLRKGRKIMFG
jgi:hypothetical protein